MDILYVLSKETGIVLAALSAVISVFAIIQASVQEKKKRNPITFHFIAGFFIVLIIFVVVLHFVMLDYCKVPDVVGMTSEEATAELEAAGLRAETMWDAPQQSKVTSQSIAENTVIKKGTVVCLLCDILTTSTATEGKDDGELEERIVLASCTISSNGIYGSYAYENLNSNVVLYQGDLYVITGGNNWNQVSQKMTFEHDELNQTFSFLIHESLPDGDYACELRGLSEDDTFVIEIHFDVENGIIYGESYSEMHSEGDVYRVTGGDGMGSDGLRS